MMIRTQISLDRESHARAKRRASAQGISLAEYVRRLVDGDLGRPARNQGDISAIFGLFRSGRSDVSSNIDKYAGEAAWEEHLRSTGQKPRP